MTITQIRCFVSLVETKKLTETANLFNLKVSTLSKYIDHIENSFSAKLFQKDQSGLILTKEGALIYPSMQFIVKKHDELLLHINKVANLDRTAMNIALAFHQYEFLMHLVEFSKIYPDVNLTISETPSSNMRPLLDTESIDMVIAYEELLKKKYHNTYPLRRDTLVAVVGTSHPLASRKHISLFELKDDNFFLFKGDPLLHSFQVRACISAGFTPSESPHDFRVDTVIDYVSANRGVALLIDNVVKNVHNGNVIALPLIENPILTLSAVFPAVYLPKTYERLISFLLKNTVTDTMSNKTSIPILESKAF